MEARQMENFNDNDPLDSSFISQISNVKTRTRQNSISSIVSCPVSKIAFSCEYCNIKNHDILVKCIDEGCNRWFCNSDKVKGVAGSHIVLHLNKLGHKVIELHNKRHCRIGKIKCIRCGNNKLFSLGMVLETKHIVCRDCCMLGNMQVNEWSVLVKDKKIDNNLINHSLPQKKQNNNQIKKFIPKTIQKKNNLVTISKIELIEKDFMADKDKDKELNLSTLEFDHRIYLKYPNLLTYKYIMLKLLKLNQRSESKICERNKIKNINFYLNDDLESGYFFGVDYGCKFSERDDIRISSYKIKKWRAIGKINKISNGKFFITFKPKAPRNMKKINMYVVNDNSTYDRLISGIKNVNYKTQNKDVLNAILGTNNKAKMEYFFNCKDYSISNRRLNYSQNKAIKRAMKYKCSVIQGPPGTGKTETIVTLIYHITNLWRRSEEYARENNERSKIIEEHNDQINKLKKSLSTTITEVDNIINETLAKTKKARDNMKEQLKKYRKTKLKEHKESIEIKSYENRNIRQNIISLISKKYTQKNLLDNYTFQIITNIKKASKRQAQIEIIEKRSIENKPYIPALVNKNEIKLVDLEINTNDKKENIKLETNEIIVKDEKNEIKLVDLEINTNDKKENTKLETNEIIVKDEKIDSLMKTFFYDETKQNESKKIHESYNSDHKILVCAASNTAVNLLKKRLIERGVKTIQIYAKYKESEYLDDKHSLHYLRNSITDENTKYKETENEIKEIEEKINYYETLPKINLSDYDAIERLKKEKNNKKSNLNKIKLAIEGIALKECEVICCTCLSTHLQTLKNFKFQHVIFDEATQALEAESLLCLTKGAEHFILVGDVKQLGAVVKSKEANALGLDVPLFERLLDLNMPQTLLCVQYRMHPKIACFSNENFYEGILENGVNEEQRTYENFSFPEPVKSVPTFFYDVCSDEELSGSGDSYLNRFEAEAIREILQYMHENNLPGNKIGIITFYDGQKGYLKTYLNSRLEINFFEEIEILSVDASQGKEKEFIILSCVRANMSQGVGFLDEFRRLNVALTRAMYGMIICGHIETLLSSSLWSKLLKYYSQYGLIFNGPFTSLSKIDIEIGDQDIVVERPKKYRKNNDFIIDKEPEIIKDKNISDEEVSKGFIDEYILYENGHKTILMGSP
ncbi:hypothetical protein SteCoe_16051 [Stentor coeruleus]|uniref:Upf1 domain-containing protein n=1 Tax=Stentor coeruleus TaxID=5963 RepID=A0A1R2C212_9CILI|nr:hypothetical protein SteCoe_16051 [Stentor coeruleus]